MTALVHRLLSTPGDIVQAVIACTDRSPQLATWDRAKVTCPDCLAPRRTAGSGLSERQLQEQIRQACALQHWLYYHTHTSRHSPAGFPDVCAVRGERLVFAELKRAGQHPTTEQARWLEALGQVTHVECHLWRPDDLARALEVLR